MSLSHEQAAAALEDIRQARSRSASLYSYRRNAPYLVLWGVVWIVGYAATYFFPRQANGVWWVLIAIGIVGGRLLSRGAASGNDWRYGATVATLFLFAFATFAIMAPVRGIQISAFFPLLVANMYLLQGIWGGQPRFVAVGIGLAALTLAGFFLIPNYFLLWMAGVGGGALMLAGFWMERA